MKILVIGGNRFVGLQLCQMLDKRAEVELHVMNRSGQVAHCKRATVHKGDRLNLKSTHLDRDWDFIFDFAAFTQREAEGAVEYFSNVGRYLFISTGSVYDNGLNLKESAFDPQKFDLKKPGLTTYQDGKRRCEATFAAQNKFPALSVRFPFILGPDDYTHRLDFHIERTERGEEIYVPNPDARFSILPSEDAARFLSWSITQPQRQNAINVASPQAISLKELFAQIQLLIGAAPLLASEESAENHSPYGLERDLSLDTTRLLEWGFKAKAVSEWLPGLILPQTVQPLIKKPGGYLH